MKLGCEHSLQLGNAGHKREPWYARRNTWLLIKLTSNGAVCSFLSFSQERDRECLAVYLRLVEAKVLRAGDGGLGGWGQVLPRLAPRLYL